MEEKQTIEGSLFRSAWDTETIVPLSLELYISRVKSEEHVGVIKRLRQLYAAGRKAKADACKKQLPLFVAGAVMKGGRRLEHLVAYTGCITIDLDQTAKPPTEVLRLAALLTYVKAGHTSPTGTGCKLFVLVDSPLERHAEAFELVRRRVEADLDGMEVDLSGKDPNRGCFMSHDPGAFYKDVAEVLYLPAPVAVSNRRPLPGSQPPGHACALVNYIDKYEAGNPFQQGTRHTFVVGLAGALNNAGFDEADATAECVRRYALPDFTATEISGTVHDIYARYHSSHGCNPFRPKQEDAPPVCVKRLKKSGGTSGNDTLPDDADKVSDNQYFDPTLPCFDKAIYTSLPAILLDILDKADGDTERDVMLLAALSLLSSAMPGVSGSLAGSEYYACLYGVVLGPSGSGKGCVASMHQLIAPWQQYIYDNSYQYVKAYKKEALEYDLQLQSYKRMKPEQRKQHPLTVDPPLEVKQKSLNVFGYVTLARFIEQLRDNDIYTSCLFETEMEAIIRTFSQDFGAYGYVLNEAAHHERIGNDSKQNGAFVVPRARLSMFLTGTDGMFRELVPSTENGLFSRLLIYKLTNGNPYRPLTSDDDTPAAAHFFDKLGQRVLDIGVHLDSSPTWIFFTDAQRKRLDRFFAREYDNLRAFGNEDLTSVVFRYRLAVFRIAMILTSLRKGEARSMEAKMQISNADFEVALSIVRTCLRHAFVVSTGLKRPEEQVRYKFPYYQQQLFADMPDAFKCADMMEQASVRHVSRSSVTRMLTKCEKIGLLISLGAGLYRKTDKGKAVVTPEVL